MDIHPQYTFDNLGNPVGVFLSIEDWNQLTEELQLDLHQWEKDMIDLRLAAYRRNPDQALDWDEVARQLRSEDKAL